MGFQTRCMSGTLSFHSFHTLAYSPWSFPVLTRQFQLIFRPVRRNTSTGSSDKLEAVGKLLTWLVTTGVSLHGSRGISPAGPRAYVGGRKWTC